MLQESMAWYGMDTQARNGYYCIGIGIDADIGIGIGIGMGGGGRRGVVD